MSRDEDTGVAEGNIARRLAALEAHEAIRTLKARYAEAVDRCIEAPTAQSAAAVADLFTEDAVADYSQFGRPEGRAAIADFFRGVLPAVAAWTRHNMMNPIVEVNDGVASGRWYAIVYGVFKSNPSAGPQTLWVRYEDTYQKTEQGWKIRTLLVHFDTPPGAG